jgi:hypothetical protein
MIYENVSALIDDFIDDEVSVSVTGTVTSWMIKVTG